MIATDQDLFWNVGDQRAARYPTSPGFKRPGTSSLAAEQTQPRARTLRDSVLAALRQRPSTSDEVASVIGKSVLATRPRLSELLALGLIQETQERRKNQSNKLATVWRIKDA